MTGIRKHLAQGIPEAKGAVAYGKFGGRLQASFLQPSQQLSPTGFGLPVAVLNSYQLLMAMLSDADNYQQAKPVIQADIAVHAVCPPIDVTRLAQIPPLPILVLIKPLRLEPGHRVGR